MFADLARRAATQFGDRPAVRFGLASVDYRTLYGRSCRLANALAAAGVAPGDRVASLGRNDLTSIEELTAAAVGGFVRSPLYMQDTPARQVYMMRRVGASALLVDAACWPGIRDALEPEDRARLRLILVRDAGEVSGADAYEPVIEAASTLDPMVRCDPDDTYIVRFSAGTTGMPKPIAPSERAYHLANIEVLNSTPPLDETDVYLAISPYSHGSGNLVWPFIAAGGCHVLMHGGFDPDQALDAIERERCTTLFLVPTMIQRLVSSPRCADTDLSSLRRIVYGAATIPKSLIEKALATFGDVLCQSYGQSEMVPITTLTPRDHRRARAGAPELLSTAGRACTNSFLRIEDDQGRVLAPGEVGEIVAKGPGMMQGIWDDPDATAERMTPDGWLRTRDLGWLDDDGYLHVADRLDDMIISGGFNIAPSEIEDALNRHAAVAEAVVFGIAHPEWGATPAAVVRLTPGVTASPDELAAWCREAVGSLKKPSRIVVTDQPLPISAAGKLLRRKARELYSDAFAG